MTLSTVAHETFVIERIYDVPVAQIFRAWADPAAQGPLVRRFRRSTGSWLRTRLPGRGP